MLFWKKKATETPQKSKGFSLRAQRLKKINLAWNFRSRLKISRSWIQISPEEKGFSGWLAWSFQSRLKISRSWIFSIFGPLGNALRAFPGIPLESKYGWDPPNPIIQDIWSLQSISRVGSPQHGGGRLSFRKWFRRRPLRAAHGIPSSTEGISE